MTFEQWFNELEGYATRAERFYEDVQLANVARMKEWLIAAYVSGSKEVSVYNKCSTCGLVFDGVTSYYCGRADCKTFMRTE